MLHKGLFANSEEGCDFHLATFVLRSAWMNQNNSRQGCSLDELTNQLKLTRDLASAQGTRGHEKTC
jgi:hypothetical protein